MVGTVHEREISSRNLFRRGRGTVGQASSPDEPRPRSQRAGPSRGHRAVSWRVPRAVPAHRVNTFSHVGGSTARTNLAKSKNFDCAARVHSCTQKKFWEAEKEMPTLPTRQQYE